MTIIDCKEIFSDLEVKELKCILNFKIQNTPKKVNYSFPVSKDELDSSIIEFKNNTTIELKKDIIRKIKNNISTLFDSGYIETYDDSSYILKIKQG
ncbi:MAG: hypothetical protein ACOCRK_02945 [bacterium]